ncbi:MAG: methyltransferase domain-containing protein [Chloroflexi bacterium]|nr:methyltransferase domain-containing protein [Chloroflexota bacterium]MBV9596393.1 methyltransferase domain-containing protein [Chloroflexota bacterium]
MQQVARAVVAAYDFSGAHTVADLGGGRGHLLATTLRAHANLRGVLFDIAETVAVAEEELRRAGILERCQLEGGDFFQSVPGDADLYILSWILHDWSDDQVMQILRNCSRSIRPGS